MVIAAAEFAVLRQGRTADTELVYYAYPQDSWVARSRGRNCVLQQVQRVPAVIDLLKAYFQIEPRDERARSANDSSAVCRTP
jgi:hypothetical protein